MHGRRLALLLLAALAPACNDDDGSESAVDTCSEEHVIDDIDDGVEPAQAASTDPAY